MHNSIYHLHDRNTGSTFTELIEVNTLEIPKLKESDESPLTDWLRFLSTDKEEELKMLGKKNEKIKKATSHLYELNQDEKTRMLYDAREKAKWDEQSRLKGTRLEIAKNLIDLKLSVEDIAKSTGLTVEAVQGLI